jgi:hypothetical protein
LSSEFLPYFWDGGGDWPSCTTAASAITKTWAAFLAVHPQVVIVAPIDGSGGAMEGYTVNRDRGRAQGLIAVIPHQEL